MGSHYSQKKDHVSPLHVRRWIIRHQLIPLTERLKTPHTETYPLNFKSWKTTKPIPVTTRTNVWFCGRSLAGIAGSNPAGGMDVCQECCVLSGRGLCDGLITRPEVSYRLWCVWVWSWVLNNEEALAHRGCCAMVKNKTFVKKNNLPLTELQ
jgi:hypothetical protein